MILRDGTLVTIQTSGGVVEVVGDIDGGVDAAAWSPDETHLVIITARKNLLLMTPDFDVLKDVQIQTVDFGEEKAVDVGWGSKTTQFHGSAGKSAALKAQEDAAVASRGGISPDDDDLGRVSWRADGAYFAVSLADGQDGTRKRRVLRVYDAQGALLTTSEPVPGLEHGLAWRPNGSIIASTQRFGFPGGGSGNKDRHDVVFFERNGLRHGEFQLREPSKEPELSATESQWDYRVKELAWSSDSTTLAVWISRNSCDAVQLWTTGNYHWYLKSEIVSDLYGAARFSSVTWHAEDPTRIILIANDKVIDRRLLSESYVSRSLQPFDTGMVGVVDGAVLKLTPFRLQNIPPPMCSHPLDLPRRQPPIHVSFSATSDRVAALWESGVIIVWNLDTQAVLKRGQACSPRVVWDSTLPSTARWRQAILVTSGDGVDEVIALGSSVSDGHDVLQRQELNTLNSNASTVQLISGGGRLVDIETLPVAWQAASGDLCEVDEESELAVPTLSLPKFCGTMRRVERQISDAFFVGLSSAGQLFAANKTSVKQLATNCNSFVTTPTFLIYTTTSHEAVFQPLETVLSMTVEQSALETRRVERGSRIVTAIPSAMSLVLQMPRGNLETVYPRPLVLEVIQREISQERYQTALIACRKHRIDLNIIVEHNPAMFLANVSKFIDQISDVDHLNLFLTAIGRSAQQPKQISEVCDAIRHELECRDLVRFVNSILTAHVVKTPPAYESALSVLLKLRESQPNMVEDATKYVIYLVDADKLFDTALGMYDFSLVLLIAQFAQKDPREYLPFLRELRSLPDMYQRFRIDEYLKKYEKALWHLSRSGSERFRKPSSILSDTGCLFRQLACGLVGALNTRSVSVSKDISIAWRSVQAVCEIYGDDLYDRRDFEQAAIVFVSCGHLQKALVAYEHALLWRELFTLAVTTGPSEALVQMGRRVADELASKKRYVDAAAVFHNYANDVESAIRMLAEGNEYAEALRLATSKPELVLSIIQPTSLDSQSQIIEGIDEMQEHLRKQRARLDELATKKLEEPEAFYGEEPSAWHNVDVMTDASGFTAFTRYTKAGTVSSHVSSKSKRKSDRRANSGKKGTIDEEKYLLTAISKLTTRLAASRVEAAKLLPHLVAFGSTSLEHGAAAKELQVELTKFEAELQSAIDHIWKEERLVPDQHGVKLKIDQPVIEKGTWRLLLLDASEYA
ncbi:IKI3-domain-containing protein [Auriculariales sp. MPI-PUGE-AT-0066]|nr:IKI3-domain-containing protein [Auriculariales sp. MPI-PUGE-AT-0066]